MSKITAKKLCCCDNNDGTCCCFCFKTKNYSTSQRTRTHTRSVRCCCYVEWQSFSVQIVIHAKREKSTQYWHIIVCVCVEYFCATIHLYTSLRREKSVLCEGIKAHSVALVHKPCEYIRAKRRSRSETNASSDTHHFSCSRLIRSPLCVYCVVCSCTSALSLNRAV